jgi:NAD/NADP transhydrogenase alpha subunit
MLIGVPLETAAGETRVAVTPETAKKLKSQGHQLFVQSGAGIAAAAPDAAYAAVGAEVVDAKAALGCELVLKVRPPSHEELALMKPGATLVETNLPALVAADASALYARNVLDFLKLVLPKDAASVNVPLMAVTNAISAIVIVGAMLAAALTETGLGKSTGVLAVALAAVNVFGGFLVTRRMLEMFRKKDEKAAIATAAPLAQ